MNRSTQTRRNGFSLVELMIALAIGMALTIVVAQLFLASRSTFTTTDDNSRMQENIRFAHQVMARTIHFAGQRASPNVDFEAVFNPAIAPVVFGAEGAAARDSDTFGVRFQGTSNGTGPADGATANCIGQTVGAADMSVNTFRIAVGRNTRNALFCNDTELIPDVQNMQVLYGVNTTAGAYYTETYVPQTAPQFVPNNVRSIRVALLLQSSNTDAAPLNDANTYNLQGEPNRVDLGPFNDRRLRRVAIFTFNLRNRTP